jgi:NAD(P)-dependent dehydrogenase (short-subunit alcohol dehydrogenase family)
MEAKIIFPDFDLGGRKAIVTGASRGIGRALALGLAHAGAKVALTGRNEKTLVEVAEQIKTKIPLARFGHVQDLIGPTVFLCSKAAEYITGQMITIDGGYLASI